MRVCQSRAARGLGFWETFRESIPANRLLISTKKCCPEVAHGHEAWDDKCWRTTAKAKGSLQRGTVFCAHVEDPLETGLHLMHFLESKGTRRLSIALRASASVQNFTFLESRPGSGRDCGSARGCLGSEDKEARSITGEGGKGRKGDFIV